MDLRIVVLACLVFAGLTQGDVRSLGRAEDRFAQIPSVDIIHGKNASIKDFPYVAALLYNGDYLGTGAILNKHWIVTAAYNAYGLPAENITVRVGSASLTEGGQVLQVSKSIIPDTYGPGWEWDVAVLKTAKPITFGKNVKQIKLATKDLKKGVKGKVAGWGCIDGDYDPATTLQKTTLTVSDRKACAAVYGSDLTDRLYCTQDKTTGPFYKDFGDPFVVKGQLHGLYAGGYQYPVGSDPVLFTSIPQVRKWIKQNIKS